MNRRIAVANPNRGSELFLALLARPLLFALWVFVLWGTLYAAALAYATVVEGTAAWRRPFSGDDPFGGVLSLIAAGIAIVVWGTIGVVVLLNRVQSQGGRAEMPHARRDAL